jgi:predicted nucleic acid-binding protein
MTLIVDASVAIKWVVQEQGSDQAHDLLARSGLIAPDLVLPEVANILWKKELRAEIDAPQRSAAIEMIRRSFDELVPTSDLVERAIELAVSFRHPAYDCFYLALAEARGGTLVTADARLLAVLALGGWSGTALAL